MQAIINGFSFWNSPNDIQGLQNQLFAVFFILNSFPNFSQLLMPRFIDDRSVFEAREGPSKMYSWYTFLSSNLIVELVWISVVAVLTFVVFFYAVGYQNGIPLSQQAERAGLMLVLIWQYFLFTSTLSYAVVAGLQHAQAAVNIAQLIFCMCTMFAG